MRADPIRDKNDLSHVRRIVHSPGPILVPPDLSPGRNRVPKHVLSREPNERNLVVAAWIAEDCKVRAAVIDLVQILPLTRATKAKARGVTATSFVD
jgi:hypothetical protein